METGSQDHEHTSACVGVEVREIYDGILWWMCSDGKARNEWVEAFQAHPQDTEIARRYMAATKVMREFR